MTWILIMLCCFSRQPDMHSMKACTPEPVHKIMAYEDDSDYEDAYDKICEELDIEGLDAAIDNVGLGGRLDVSRLIRAISEGDGEYAATYIWEAIRYSLTSEIIANKGLMISLISIALIGGLFVNMAGSFGQGFISENGFYVTYLIMTSIMLTSFSVTLDMVASTIEKLLQVIRIIVPVYALAMNYVGNVATAAGMYQVVLVAVWIVEYVILKFILPMIKLYVIITMLNNLNKEDNFSKLCKLIKSIINWLLKTIVIFVVGLNLIKSLIEPQIDALGRNTVNRIANIIPGGGVMSVLMGTFLGAGMIIKNSIGVAGIFLILILVIAPVMKTLLIMLTVKLTAALIQPIGDKRFVEGVDSLSKGIGLLLQAVFCSVVLFMLTIAIMAFSGGG